MIKNIFLPEKIRAFYLFSQRIVAFELHGNILLTTVIRAHRDKRSIQKLIAESYNAQAPESLTEAIKATLKKVGTYDQAYIALPSSLAVFKTVELPFTSLDKIKLILPFEVESLLPFPLQDAVVDGVINAIDTEKKTSEVFVVAIKNSLLENALTPFINAGIHPKKVTIGALELFGLLQNIETYRLKKGVSFIIDFANTRTTILLVVNGQLKAIRALSEGISEEFLRLHNNANAEQLELAAQKYFEDIRFSLQAMLKNERIQSSVASVLISGTGAHLSGLTTFMSKFLNCPCILFHPHKILHNSVITLEQEGSIPAEFAMSVATAISSPVTEDFNLGKMYDEPQQLQLFKKQVITLGTLLLIMFLSFGIYSFWTLRNLRNEANNSKLEVAKALNKAFGPTIKSDQIPKSLESLLQQARQKQENIWFALSPSNRSSYLYYLSELTSRINRDELGLNMKLLSIKSDEREGRDVVTFEGSVRDYPALITLAKNLRETNLFEYVPEPQETSFSMVLTIQKNQGAL
jgi:Tfp pilus assembly PilM family ATPase